MDDGYRKALLGLFGARLFSLQVKMNKRKRNNPAQSKKTYLSFTENTLHVQHLQKINQDFVPLSH